MHVIAALWGDLRGNRAQAAALLSVNNQEAPHSRFYGLLQTYYTNNGLYDELSRFFNRANVKVAAIKGLRNPAFRVVEYYPSNLWPGPLPDALKLTFKGGVDEGQLTEDIHAIWENSNWNENKQVFVRMLALYGDAFLKVAQDNEGMPFLQVIDPNFVTALKKDHRGRLTRIRLDIPQYEDNFKERRTKTEEDRKTTIVTELWDLELDSHRTWEHKKGIEKSIDELGEATEIVKISEEYGIDYLPFKHCPFTSIGENHGVGAFTLQLDKIDEVNQMATRLHQMLYRYNKAFGAITTNAIDKDGRPQPAPNIPNALNANTSASNPRRREVTTGTVKIDDETLMTLPGNADMKWLVPDIDWQGHLNSIKAQMDELSDDLPEMKYYDEGNVPAVNARAAFQRLAPAIRKMQEVRGNAEKCLIEAHQMALFMGAKHKKFKTAYDKDPKLSVHAFEPRPFIQMSEIDQAETDQAKVNVLVAKKQLGVDDETLLKELGYKEDEIPGMVERKQEALLRMQQTFTQAEGKIPSNEEQDGQNPGFNKGAQENEDSAVQNNGRPRQVRGVKG